MQSPDPTAQAFWKQIAPDGKEPPVEKVIATIALMVQDNKLCSWGAIAPHFLFFKYVLTLVKGDKVVEVTQIWADNNLFFFVYRQKYINIKEIIGWDIQ